MSGSTHGNIGELDFWVEFVTSIFGLENHPRIARVIAGIFPGFMLFASLVVLWMLMHY